ncbi:hypothetical protein [Allosphingosinicella sp.]|uniref:hypothetical protein n=1 Tax=Allosphingosinicella sp. TaxID=2823234 RepID=UPI002FC229D4
MPLPRPASPRALWEDLRAFAKERSRVQWIAALFAMVIPVSIIVLFYYDTRTNIAPGEQLIYVESWSANRTDAEIAAAQKERQAREDAIAVERQRQFKELERQFGI